MLLTFAILLFIGVTRSVAILFLNWFTPLMANAFCCNCKMTRRCGVEMIPPLFAWLCPLFSSQAQQVTAGNYWMPIAWIMHHWWPGAACCGHKTFTSPTRRAQAKREIHEDGAWSVCNVWKCALTNPMVENKSNSDSCLLEWTVENKRVDDYGQWTDYKRNTFGVITM